MALGWASDNHDLRTVPVETLAERFNRADIKTRYYTPDVHAASFALPKYILDAVEEGLGR